MMKGRCILKKRTLQLSLFLLLCVFILNASGCGSSNNSPVANSYAGSKYETTEKNETANNGYTVTGTKDFSDGYAWISIRQGAKGQSKRACIDTSGKIQFILDDIVEGTLTNDQIRDFKSGYAAVKDNSNNTYILDTKGNIVSSSKTGNYDHIVCYGDGYFLTEKKNNNLHEVNYTFSVIDANENYLLTDCYTTEKEITDYYAFNYRGDNIFSYTRYSNGYGSGYDFINVKTGKVFAIDVDAFYGYSDNKGIARNDSKNQIVDVNGNYTEIPLERCYAKSSIYNNSFAYQKSNDDSLYVYNLSTGQSKELYHCGTGISAKICDYNNEVFLLNIVDTTTKTYEDWFTLVDYQGNELFAPKEGDPIGFSSDRITANYENHADKIKVFDNKGNEIIAAKEGELALAQNDIYHDGFLCVNTNASSAFSGINCNNYIDINGNLLFPDGTITI